MLVGEKGVQGTMYLRGFRGPQRLHKQSRSCHLGHWRGGIAPPEHGYVLAVQRYPVRGYERTYGTKVLPYKHHDTRVRHTS